MRLQPTAVSCSSRKTAIERLDAKDAQALALDPDALGFRTVVEIPSYEEGSAIKAGSLSRALTATWGVLS